MTWYWRSLPLQQRTGAAVFDQLFRRHHPIATLLESPFPSYLEQPELARYSICAGAPMVRSGKSQLWTPAVGQILPLLRSLLTKSKPQTNPDNLPFTGGWLGWLGYDLAWEIEDLPRLKPDTLPFPVAYWYEPDTLAIADHLQQILWLAAATVAELDRLEQQLAVPVITTNQTTEFSNFALLTSQPHYQAAVKKALKYIHAGDIFQANLSLRFQVSTAQDPWIIYQRLSQINPSPFASYWQTPWGIMISCSPERLVQLHGNQAQTRPIAGTRPRGLTPALDVQLAQELISTTKERAEHIMLVDLERNDLGRVCQWGSVTVDELLTIERYSHVMHLVSNIKGTLSADYDAIDLIRAVSPGGTITGCPKVRCLEIIEELEPVRRNLFYGSCGYINYNGNLDLNILIRTLLWENGIVWGQVGAGIVADSDPQQEWRESLFKAKAQLAALGIQNLDSI
ncbi:anthranilate synthase component I [Gloeocapsa sp. PCC 73106]|uniref:anthranilate synthase component I n=1 Tax=Gloeocapsa sp. PCC 73106 TaxID=102232 RepID=UPI0002ABAF79|nr:anthranilate synthase component I [Gloeocapsa sp. PCC 73106]ELR97118.1 aminodeoxychorismate synthase, component I, clade 2 [Gloeocapsa sp. PCC 73106]